MVNYARNLLNELSQVGISTYRNIENKPIIPDQTAKAFGLNLNTTYDRIKNLLHDCREFGTRLTYKELLRKKKNSQDFDLMLEVLELRIQLLEKDRELYWSKP